MIKLLFSINTETFTFLIERRSIYYTDRKWGVFIRCLPRPIDFITKIRNSRNKLPTALINFFSFTDKDLAEYDSCKTEDDLADMIVKDSKLKGCKLVVRKTFKEGEYETLDGEIIADETMKATIDKIREETKGLDILNELKTNKTDKFIPIEEAIKEADSKWPDKPKPNELNKKEKKEG
jgi:hypothetical protein